MNDLTNERDNLREENEILRQKVNEYETDMAEFNSIKEANKRDRGYNNNNMNDININQRPHSDEIITDYQEIKSLRAKNEVLKRQVSESQDKEEILAQYVDKNEEQEIELKHYKHLAKQYRDQYEQLVNKLNNKRKRSKEEKKSDTYNNKPLPIIRSKQCKLCHQRITNNKLFKFSKCKCYCCLTCALQLIQNKLKKRDWPINCLICNKMRINPNDLKQLDNKNQIYNEYVNLSLREAAPECPDCGKMTKLKDLKQSNSNKYVKSCKTMRCHYKICTQCYCPYDIIHKSLDCTDVKKIWNDPEHYWYCKNCKRLIINTSDRNGKEYQPVYVCEDKYKDKNGNMRNCFHSTCFKCGATWDMTAKDHKKCHDKTICIKQEKKSGGDG